MLLIRPSFEILTPLDGEAILKTIEVAGRTCYKSEGRITANRGFTHELVRPGLGPGVLPTNYATRALVGD